MAVQPNRLIEEIVKTQFFLEGTRQKSFVPPQLNGGILSDILNDGRYRALACSLIDQRR